MREAARGKGQVIYKSRSIRSTSEFSVQTLKVGTAWVDVLQTLRDDRYHV